MTREQQLEDENRRLKAERREQDNAWRESVSEQLAKLNSGQQEIHRFFERVLTLEETVYGQRDQPGLKGRLRTVEFRVSLLWGGVTAAVGAAVTAIISAFQWVQK